MSGIGGVSNWKMPRNLSHGCGTVQVCTAVMVHGGFSIVQDGRSAVLNNYMDQHGYHTLDDFRASRANRDDWRFSTSIREKP